MIVSSVGPLTVMSLVLNDILLQFDMKKTHQSCLCFLFSALVLVGIFLLSGCFVGETASQPPRRGERGGVAVLTHADSSDMMSFPWKFHLG